MQRFCITLFFVCLSVCSTISLFGGTVDCGTTDACCANTCYERYGEITPDPGPFKSDVPPRLGKKSPIAIYSGDSASGAPISGTGICAEYTSGGEVLLSCVGGEDVDVCYRPPAPPEVPGPSYNGYGVPSTIVWSGAPGLQDANSSSVFHMRPTAPGQYTVTVTSQEGSGQCNAGTESESTSTLISLWRISNITPETTTVLRGQSQQWAIELQNCDPVSTYPLWSSKATTATGEGLSWGGEHCISYPLKCLVQATCRCQNTSHSISVTRQKNVRVIKGRTFNCTLRNIHRYPVPESDRDKGDLAVQMLTDSCDAEANGVTWAYPYKIGDGQGAALADTLTPRYIGSGPNAFWYYIQNISAPLDIDTNTNTSYTSSTTVWHINHVALGLDCDALHRQAQAHEERHYQSLVDAEAEMDGDGATTTHPVDLYDRCESVTGRTVEELKTTAAAMIQGGIDQDLYVRAFEEIDVSRHVDDNNYRQHCTDNKGATCDYYRYLLCPGQHNCAGTTDTTCRSQGTCW